MTNTQQALLDLLSKALFNHGDIDSSGYNWQEIKEEALDQTIFTVIYPVICNMLPEELSSEWKMLNYRLFSNNMKVVYGHGELHDLMCENDIPYTSLKGFSSAYYYPVPFNRIMGDVDFLVNTEDLSRTEDALKSVGFQRQDDVWSMHHYEYLRGKFVWELHYTMDGIKEGVCGDKAKENLTRFIDRSRIVEYNGMICKIPCEFDHALIMLIHVAKHFTNGEGIGLRHLCDWAVYVDKVDISLYKDKFVEVGLWTFACQLTAACIKYLGIRNYDWCKSVSDEFLDMLMEDIFTGGNFGCKTENRGAGYRMVRQGSVIGSLSSRAKEYYPFCKKYALLLPLGMIMYCFVFLWRRITGKKKWVKLSSIQDGLERRQLYEQFKLYENG